jgi:hypothetical protein
MISFVHATYVARQQRWTQSLQNLNFSNNLKWRNPWSRAAIDPDLRPALLPCPGGGGAPGSTRRSRGGRRRSARQHNVWWFHRGWGAAAHVSSVPTRAQGRLGGLCGGPTSAWTRHSIAPNPEEAGGRRHFPVMFGVAATAWFPLFTSSRDILTSPVWMVAVNGRYETEWKLVGVQLWNYMVIYVGQY